MELYHRRLRSLLNLWINIATTTLLVIVLLTTIMVNFFKDDPNTSAEAKVDLKMQSLRNFSMHSPATIAKNRLNSMATSSTGDITVEKEGC